jgi:hypothetical protein
MAKRSRSARLSLTKRQSIIGEGGDDAGGHYDRLHAADLGSRALGLELFQSKHSLSGSSGHNMLVENEPSMLASGVADT